jgi:hypothetical protein
VIIFSAFIKRFGAWRTWTLTQIRLILRQDTQKLFERKTEVAADKMLHHQTGNIS